MMSEFKRRVEDFENQATAIGVGTGLLTTVVVALILLSNWQHFAVARPAESPAGEMTHWAKGEPNRLSLTIVLLSIASGVGVGFLSFAASGMTLALLSEYSEQLERRRMKEMERPKPGPYQEEIERLR